MRVDEGLEYFRQQYTGRPVKYPGDEVYIICVLDCIATGLGTEEAVKESIKVVDRCMGYIDCFLPIGVEYSPSFTYRDYDLECLTGGHTFQLPKSVQNSFIGDLLKEVPESLAKLVGKGKTEKKSWRHPYKYHK